MCNPDSRYTIGVDFGTLSARAVLVDVSNGREAASAVYEYPHGVIDGALPSTGEKLPPLWALQDPADYLEALEAVLRRVTSAPGVKPERIIAIGIDFTASTVIPVDSGWKPLRFDPRFAGEKNAWVKLWKHHAAQKYADRINDLYARTGGGWMDVVCGRMSGEAFLPKVWQTLDEAPEVYEAADSFVEAGDWITMQLTGKPVRSYVIASYKSCYTDEYGYPPDAFLEQLDPRLRGLFARKCRGPIVRAGETAGFVTSEAAERFGLPEGIPVAAPMPDAHIGGYPVGLSDDGDMFGIFGTSNCYFLMSAEKRDVPGICGCVPDGILPGFYGYEAGLCCFGDHFAWAAENLSTAGYLKEAEERGITPLRLLIEKASALAPGESGLIALDWWNGNRSILVDSGLSGLIIGMNLQTRPEHIMRALIEATAFGTKMIFENFRENGIDIKRFIAAGGVPLKDPFTMQLFSDVLGIDIEVSSTRQAAALGDAIHAAAVAGPARGGYAGISEAQKRMRPGVSAVYRPDPAAAGIYGRLFSEYRILHDTFGRGGNDVMKRLREIGN